MVNAINGKWSPQYMLSCIFKALFMNESTLILRCKQKLFMAGTLLICGSLSSYFFLASRRFVLAFKALFMARLLSWWDQVAYDTTVVETLTGYKSSTISHLVIVRLPCTWCVTPCSALKSALRLPPRFWYCLCLGILFMCQYSCPTPR